MYKKILIALDNSPDANVGVDLAVAIAKKTGADITGTHVYAARLHDERFAQMEATLPSRYQAPDKLKRQRVVHESLIERGLKTIADSYSLALEEKARTAGLIAKNRPREGKNYSEILSELKEGAYDLLVLGACGLGKIEKSTIGSVCERVARRARVDTLVTKFFTKTPRAPVILVGIDGSQNSFGALVSAIRLSRAFDAKVEAVSVYDADFHYKAFSTLSKMLPKEAQASFDFAAQGKLHEEIIDNGLRAIYSGHLESAKRLAALEGVEIETKLLAGKPYGAILGRVEEIGAFMLALGRTGFHADAGLDIGSNAENSLRNAPCHVLISVQRVLNVAPSKSEATGNAATGPKWSIEALELLDRIPIFAREMAKRLVEKRAEEAKVSLITDEYMREVRNKLGMPGMGEKMGKKTGGPRDGNT